MTIPIPDIVSVMTVLRDCGWVPNGDRTLSEEAALKYNFGNFELLASVTRSRYLQQVVSVEGLCHDRRVLDEIAFEMPERVESREQVLAWIVYGLRHGVPLAITPDWVEEGRRSQHELPWVKQRAAYDARPKATVDRMWMKPLGKALRDAALSAAERVRCLIHFDGAAVRFQLSATTFLVQGSGPRPWSSVVAVNARDLTALPQRWMDGEITMAFWDGHLEIANRRFRATV